jgi:hypothetical protein
MPMFQVIMYVLIQLICSIKLRFCRGINDAVASHLEENVKATLSCEVLTINQIPKFAQKA